MCGSGADRRKDRYFTRTKVAQGKIGELLGKLHRLENDHGAAIKSRL